MGKKAASGSTQPLPVGMVGAAQATLVGKAPPLPATPGVSRLPAPGVALLPPPPPPLPAALDVSRSLATCAVGSSSGPTAPSDNDGADRRLKPCTFCGELYKWNKMWSQKVYADLEPDGWNWS